MFIWLTRKSRSSETVPQHSPLGFAREKVYALHVKIFGQFGFGGRSFVTIESLKNRAVYKADLGCKLVKLRLRQSAADSSSPEIDIAARRERKLSLDNDVGKMQSPTGLEDSIDFPKRADLVR